MKIYSKVSLLFFMCLWNTIVLASAKDKMSFFIVADAHVGWDKPDQPSPDKQREVMNTILSTFPGIDFFFDAGDNTYPYEDAQQYDEMRKNWTSIEPNACIGIPFFYTAGNHEAMHWAESDPESQCALIGSLPCRPYYSISHKNIHIISLPELVRTSFLTKELLDWLDLDLKVHKSQTTLIITHNSIMNTTGNDAPGYRGLMQSAQMFKLFKNNPQIIAWMHGHNHDYAVVKREDMLFVSVGRLGGFSSKSTCPLGGMYVEITSSGINVRGYNGEARKFMEGTQGNNNNLPANGFVLRKTSFNAKAKTDICFGIGKDQNSSKTPVFNHFAGGTAMAYIIPEKDKTLNDNPDFALYAERKSPTGIDQQLLGFGVRVQGTQRKSGYKAAVGDLSMELSGNEGVLYAPDLRRSTGYYHAVPGKSYCVTVELTAPTARGTLELSMYPGSTEEVANDSHLISMDTFQMKAGRGTYMIKGIMKTSGKTIYSDPLSNVLPTIVARARVNGVDSVTLNSFVISRVEDISDELPALTIGGKRFAAKSTPGGLWLAEMGNVMRDARTVVETSTNGISSWLISKQDIDWQVRNATVTENEKSLSIQSIRNPWGADEILVAPLFNTDEPYIAKTTGIHSMEIYPINRGNKTLRVNVRGASDSAALVVKSAKKPQSVAGVVSWDYSKGLVHALVKANSRIELTF